MHVFTKVYASKVKARQAFNLFVKLNEKKIKSLTEYPMHILLNGYTQVNFIAIEKPDDVYGVGYSRVRHSILDFDIDSKFDEQTIKFLRGGDE